MPFDAFLGCYELVACNKYSTDAGQNKGAWATNKCRGRLILALISRLPGLGLEFRKNRTRHVTHSHRWRCPN